MNNCDFNVLIIWQFDLFQCAHPKVLAEHPPHVLNKVVHIQLKPVSKNIEDYEVDFLCLM